MRINLQGDLENVALFSQFGKPGNGSGLGFQLFVKAKVVAWPRKAELLSSQGPAVVVVGFLSWRRKRLYVQYLGITEA